MPSETAKTVATFVGVLPGPRNGMTLLTEAVVDALRSRVSLRVFDVGEAYRKPGWLWKIGRGIRGIQSALWLLATAPRRASEPVYLVANSGGGLYYNLLQAAAARLRGFRVVLHHHVYSYIDAYDWRAASLLRLCGKNALHIVHCPMMGDSINKRYRASLNYEYLAPSLVSGMAAFGVGACSDTLPLVIGHLSNLTLEKGVGEVVKLARLLAQRGKPFRCLIAGPFASAEARIVVEAAMLEMPDSVEWLGPLYGADKHAFFERLHAFVFPTRYRNESWGMVLDEALATGTPVITYETGATPHLVGVNGGSVGGLVIDPKESLPEVAAEAIAAWIDSSEAYAEAANNARRRGEELATEGAEGLLRLLTHFGVSNEDDNATATTIGAASPHNRHVVAAAGTDA